MKIRLLKEKDIAVASKIVGTNYPTRSRLWERLSRQEMKSMFKNYLPPSYLVAEDDGKIIGLTGYAQSWMDYHVYHIFWVNVLPKYWNQGVGTALVKTAIHNVRKKKGNDKALMILLTARKPSLYRKLGFKMLTKFRKEKYHLMMLNMET